MVTQIGTHERMSLFSTGDDDAHKQLLCVAYTVAARMHGTMLCAHKKVMFYVGYIAIYPQEWNVHNTANNNKPDLFW